jgi:hypothetical protein
MTTHAQALFQLIRCVDGFMIRVLPLQREWMRSFAYEGFSPLEVKHETNQSPMGQVPTRSLLFAPVGGAEALSAPSRAPPVKRTLFFHAIWTAIAQTGKAGIR